MYTMDTVSVDIEDFEYVSTDDLIQQALERVDEVIGEAEANVLSELEAVRWDVGSVDINVGGWDTEVSAFRRRWFGED